MAGKKKTLRGMGRGSIDPGIHPDPWEAFAVVMPGSHGSCQQLELGPEPPRDTEGIAMLGRILHEPEGSFDQLASPGGRVKFGIHASHHSYVSLNYIWHAMQVKEAYSLLVTKPDMVAMCVDEWGCKRLTSYCLRRYRSGATSFRDPLQHTCI